MSNTTTNRPDVYSKITDKIIADLEQPCSRRAHWTYSSSIAKYEAIALGGNKAVAKDKEETDSNWRRLSSNRLQVKGLRNLQPSKVLGPTIWLPS